jgi:AAA15 family ATPase/GTPase
MKLESIKKIKGYKSFQDFDWEPFFHNETFHEEVNIIYGENGSGKSSIVNILKNVLKGDDIFNKNFGYKSFGKYKPKEASIVFDLGECNYVRKEFGDPGALEHIQSGNIGNFWDKKLNSNDAILFFDREFVAKNVHEYERKTTKDGQEQQSGKLIIEFDSNAIKLRGIKDELIPL